MIDLPIEIDRRQRLAATILLLGFDLPSDAELVFRQMASAAKITPGCKMDEITTLTSTNRISALFAAKKLIDEMLAEVGE